MGSMAGERCSSQASAIWLGVAPWLWAIRASDRIWAGEPTHCQRVPRNKGNAGTGAHIDQPVGRSVAEIVAVLDGDAQNAP